MNLIHRDHHFLLQIKKHFCESRLLFREGEHGPIYHFNSQRGLHAFTALVGYRETDPRLTAGFLSTPENPP